MKKTALFLFSLIVFLNSFAIESASEFDEYSTKEPVIKAGTQKGKQNIKSMYFYNENDSYKIYTRAGYVSTILLNPDEDILHAEIGDATRWYIQTYYTGTEKGMTPAITIKPFVPELKTNLIISTSKRTYNFMLEAAYNSYNPIVTFEYPKEIQIAKRREADLKAQATSVNIHNLNFNYFWKKGKYSWSPEQVFDDGEKTIIILPESIKATQLPVLFIKDEQTGDAAMIRHRYDPVKREFIIDRLFQQAILRYGEQEIIIKRKGSFIKSSHDHVSISL
ncbi:TrbG/VirB9 family P-type conjugative transfer protein [Fusobacterium necrophorum]|uniref:TrbG/VirB9 family P-type conjugative transfer protein n=1 Tax=Fusobacterium TaxID=848 RepID=UPI0025501A7A|nr:TrbG/VirB9 family P-type conjugative transfer protein [Fusobacterium necrophorum]MDK4494999.1 TrbG/VirB9 family P-type conjugative transfer protein [Fusobacterium necrophorum]